MKWLQLYLLVGFIVATGWDSQLQMSCGKRLGVQGFVALTLLAPLVATLTLFDPKPTCENVQG